MLRTAIPLIDMRTKTPIDLLRSYPDVARELVDSARRSYGLAGYLASFPVLPLADRRAHRWLARNKNPYLHEIESCADILETTGIFALNLSYEFGCTTVAWRTSDTVSMLRVLDWPVAKLGKHVMVVMQTGKAGDFYNMTWPGVSGVFTAMAPGRFSGALNQAPMRRHSRHSLKPIDWLSNCLQMDRETGLPPAHLLRQVFEKAVDYNVAKEMLMQTSIAVPAIFTLAGCEPGEGCIIERLEHTAEVIELSAGQMVSAANHFQTVLHTIGQGWRPREIDSIGRLKQSVTIGGYELTGEDFRFLQAPMINVNTRLGVIADAATGRLVVQGFEGVIPVSSLFTIPAGTMHEQRQAV